MKHRSIPRKKILPQLQQAKPSVCEKEVLVASVKSYLKVQEKSKVKAFYFCGNLKCFIPLLGKENGEGQEQTPKLQTAIHRPAALSRSWDAAHSPPSLTSLRFMPAGDLSW